MAATPKPRTPLSREHIVDTALAIVDAEGLEALSMRRLGAELGANPMAAYYYVPNKAALLDVVVEAVMAEIDLSIDDPSRPAEERLFSAAKAYADVLFRHRNTLPVLLARGPATPAALAPVELMVAILRDGGLSLEHALAGMNIVTAAVRGYVSIVAAEMADPEHGDIEGRVALSSPLEFPHLSQAAAEPHQDLQAQFEFGLRAIAAGLLGPHS
ncbi:MAG: TetR/AcrR family transcriptional regulator C-terminal domain-containing protein [Coriobacteriia bacterium]